MSVWCIRRHPIRSTRRSRNNAFPRLLAAMRPLRLTDETFYLRLASINLFNGMISVTFSCDGSHYMHYDEFLTKSHSFWFGAGG